MIYDEYGETEGDFNEVYVEYEKRYGPIEDVGADEGATEVAEEIERLMEQQISGEQLGEQLEGQITQDQIMQDQIMQQQLLEQQLLQQELFQQQLMEEEQLMQEQLQEAEEEYMGEFTQAQVRESVQEVIKSPKVSCQYEEQEPEPDKALDAGEIEFVHGKNYLQTASKETGDNVYDHLTDMLNKLLAERPTNVIDFFEEYSRKIKEKRFKPLTDHLEDIFVEPERFQLANCMMPWLKNRTPHKLCKGKVNRLDAVDMSGNNMMELLFYLEQIGLGLPKQDMAFITLSMRQLVKTEPIVSIRFWGKIYGRFCSYIIVETELMEEEYIKRNESQKKVYSDTYLYQSYSADQKNANVGLDGNPGNRQEIEGEGGDSVSKERKLPPLPKMEYKELPEPPDELSGEGLNKKVYYVNNGIGKPWVQLPDVTPKEVRLSRYIQRSFTGYLEHAVQTYPEFPGKEKSLLRAQIARITAGTHIAPVGYYTFDAQLPVGDGDKAECCPQPNQTYVIKNPEYEPPKLKQLMNKSSWVHASPYILPQGRTTWWKPPVPFPDLEDDESIECECTGGTCVACIIEEIKKIVPETGPPLLTRCCADVSAESVPAWSIRASSNITDEFALVIMRSNVWPGAYTFTTQGKTFCNVYIGYGLKYLKANFTPQPLPLVQQEYPIGPEVLEILDQGGEEWGGGSEEEGDVCDNWCGMPLPMEEEMQ